MIFITRRSFWGPKNGYCRQIVTLTGVTVIDRACIKQLILHSLMESLLCLLELGAAEGPVHAGEGAALGVAVVALTEGRVNVG